MATAYSQLTIRNIGRGDTRSDPQSRDFRIQIVLSFIEENYHRKLTLSEMAELVNLSVSRLAHVFKGQIGTSPEHYLTQLRLERARRYLESSFRPVKEVARLVGLCDLSHFTKAFKSIYGFTPAQYRKTYLARNFSARDRCVAGSANG